MGRIIMIGDVHGCADELERLLDRLNPVETDFLLATGDFTSKGKDVVRSLELWRSAGGESVLGNNDAAFLRLWDQDADTGEFDEADRELLEHEELIEWMSGWPNLIDLEFAGVTVVHGGLLPGRTVRENAEGDPSVLLELRHVRRVGSRWEAVDDEKDADSFWADAWSGERIIVYGHTPNREGTPRLHTRAIGLDTGAVYGAALTALVIEEASARGDVATLLASGSWRIEYIGQRA